MEILFCKGQLGKEEVNHTKSLPWQQQYREGHGFRSQLYQ